MYSEPGPKCAPILTLRTRKICPKLNNWRKCLRENGSLYNGNKKIECLHSKFIHKVKPVLICYSSLVLPHMLLHIIKRVMTEWFKQRTSDPW